jgi:hypothetical protein
LLQLIIISRETTNFGFHDWLAIMTLKTYSLQILSEHAIAGIFKLLNCEYVIYFLLYYQLKLMSFWGASRGQF